LPIGIILEDQKRNEEITTEANAMPIIRYVFKKRGWNGMTMFIDTAEIRISGENMK